MDTWKNQLSSLSSGLNVTTLNDARLKLTQQVKSTAKSIATEFQETAKELRDAHSEFGGVRGGEAGVQGYQGVEGGAVRFAFPAELNGGGAGRGATDVRQEASASYVREPLGQAAENIDEPQSVSDRLAALKEKLQRQKLAGASPREPIEEPEREKIQELEQQSKGDDGDREVMVLLKGRVEELENQVEKAARKHEHLLGLYEDAEVAGRAAADRAGVLEAEVRRLQEENRELIVREREARDKFETSMNAADGAGSIVQEAGAARSLEDESQEVKSLKEQLEKLKVQMMASQTAFEEQIEAEVRERMSTMPASSKQNRDDNDDQLLADLEIALDKIQEAEKESASWKSEAERMQRELRNMQIALDDLRYESEAGERLRVQVRSAQAEVSAMEERVAEALALKDAFESKAAEAVQKADEERRKAVAARESEGAAKQEMIALRVAYNDLASKLQQVEEGTGAYASMKRETVVAVMKEMAGMRHGKAMKYGVDALGLNETERRSVLGDGSGLASTFVTFLETSVED